MEDLRVVVVECQLFDVLMQSDLLHSRLDSFWIERRKGKEIVSEQSVVKGRLMLSHEVSGFLQVDQVID